MALGSGAGWRASLGGMVEGRLEALEARSQRSAQCVHSRDGPVSAARDRAWEPQARGPGHVHPVFHVYSPGDVEVAKCYLRHVARLGRRHGVGFVGEEAGRSMQVMSGDRAAAYLSSYFVRGKGLKATCRRTLATRIYHGC